MQIDIFVFLCGCTKVSVDVCLHGNTAVIFCCIMVIHYLFILSSLMHSLSVLWGVRWHDSMWALNMILAPAFHQKQAPIAHSCEQILCAACESEAKGPRLSEATRFISWLELRQCERRRLERMRLAEKQRRERRKWEGECEGEKLAAVSNKSPLNQDVSGLLRTRCHCFHFLATKQNSKWE